MEGLRIVVEALQEVGLLPMHKKVGKRFKIHWELIFRRRTRQQEQSQKKCVTSHIPDALPTRRRKCMSLDVYICDVIRASETYHPRRLHFQCYPCVGNKPSLMRNREPCSRLFLECVRIESLCLSYLMRREII